MYIYIIIVFENCFSLEIEIIYGIIFCKTIACVCNCLVKYVCFYYYKYINM